MQFRKKPVVIEAIQFNGKPLEVCNWVERVAEGSQKLVFSGDGTCIIRTLEGDMTAQTGDWIICGVKGELYPCKPDIFDATYEPATT